MHKAVDLTKFTKEINKSLSISSGFNDPTDWVSTGNYLLNYLISGDWYKGIPLGKLTMFAGGSGSGKSLVCSGNLVRECQKHDIMPIVLDTENALDEEWLLRLGVDTSPDKLMRFPVVMINDVGKILHTFIEDYKEKYLDLEPEERPKFMFIIDSLGMLITDTDADQFRKGDMKGDMGRKPKQLNALVRNIMGKIADCNIGVVCTNHTYDSQDMFDPDQKISGGNGIIFASSIVVASEKFKLKEDREGKKGTDVLGIRSKFKVMKTRYGRPYEVANTHIRFDTGLDPFSGCLDYFERVGVVQKEGNKLKYITKDGEEIKEFRKGFTDEKLKIIINEWDYEKYRLISADTDELAHDELAPTSDFAPTEEPKDSPTVYNGDKD